MFTYINRVAMFALLLGGLIVLPAQAEQPIPYTSEQIAAVEEAGWGTIASDGTLVPEWLFDTWDADYARRTREGVSEHCARWVGSWIGQSFAENGRPGRTKRVTVIAIGDVGPESCAGTAIVSASHVPGSSWGTSPSTKTWEGPWWRKYNFDTDGNQLSFQDYPPTSAQMSWKLMEGGYIERKATYTGSRNSMGGGMRTWDVDWTARMQDKPLTPHPDSSVAIGPSN